MEDKADPAVTIMLDKERHLLLTFRAMRAFREATGRDIKSLGKTNKEEDVEALLWVCLLHEDREITLEDAGHLIHIKNMQYVVDALEKAFEMAQPEGGKEDAPPLARRPNRKSRRG